MSKRNEKVSKDEMKHLSDNNSNEVKNLKIYNKIYKNLQKTISRMQKRGTKWNE